MIRAKYYTTSCPACKLDVNYTSEDIKPDYRNGAYVECTHCKASIEHDGSSIEQATVLSIAEHEAILNEGSGYYCSICEVATPITDGGHDCRICSDCRGKIKQLIGK